MFNNRGMLHKLPICPKIQRWTWCQWKWGFQDTFKDTGKCSPHKRGYTSTHNIMLISTCIRDDFSCMLFYISDESEVFFGWVWSIFKLQKQWRRQEKKSLISHFKCKMVFWNVYSNENTFQLILLLAVNSYMKVY